MKIKSVTISGMHNIGAKPKTYPFNDTNYLFGRNGAGKSTVLQAIQLAVLGYVPGYPKTAQGSFLHANGPEMEVRVDLDNGHHIQRTWKSKGRSVESKIDSDLGYENVSDIVGDLELPVFNFGELIGMTANKMKDWFINFLPDASEEIDWDKELKDSLDGLNLMDKNLMNQIKADIECVSKDDKSTIEVIQTLNEKWKEELSYLKNELKRSEGTIQSLVYYDEDDLTGDDESLAEEIQRCKDAISRLTQEKESLIKYSQILQQNQNIQNQLAAIPKDVTDVEELNSKTAELAGKITDLQKAIMEKESEISTSMQKMYQIDADIRAKKGIIDSKGICPYTRTSCDSITTMIEEFTSEIESLTSQKNEITATGSTLQTETQKLKSDLSKAQLELNQIANQISSANNNKASRERLQNLITAVPDMSGLQSIEYYNDQIQSKNERITKIEANRRYSKLIEELTADKYRIENTIEAYKCWIKLTDPNGLQTKVMDAPFKGLAEDMNKYLAKMFSSDHEVTCNFNLEQKANSFSFGINRDNSYIPYDLLSSGEKTMYTLALMLCIIDKSSSELRLLIVDDMMDHLDDARADELFTAIHNVDDIQIILAGVKQSKASENYIVKIE